MRLSRTDLSRRINGKLSIRSSTSSLTSHAGLELYRHYLKVSGIRELMQTTLTKHLPGTDYGRVPMVLLLLALLVIGGRRLRHLDYCKEDPMVERFCSLNQLPSARTVSRWLGRFTMESVEGLRELNRKVTRSMLQDLSLPRLTIDIDGSVISTGMQTQGAERGYNPHRRKVPSYYPISAYEANSGIVLDVLNRSGNVHDGKASPAFIKRVLTQCEMNAGRQGVREIRLDGAFFRREILELLDAEKVEYAIKATFHDWLGLKQKILERKRWKRVEPGVEYFTTSVYIKPWGRKERISIYRRYVNHKRTKWFQLDLFDPDDGHYEYSAVASNKALKGPALWHFMNGRSVHEKVYGELKSGYAFASIPTQQYFGNSAWQLLNVLAFNITRSLQYAIDNTRRAKTQKRRTHVLYENIKGIRHRLVNCAGLLLNISGMATLDLGQNKTRLDEFLYIQERLECAE